MTIPARAMHFALQVFCFCVACLALGHSFIYLTFNEYLLIARYWAYTVYKICKTLPSWSLYSSGLTGQSPLSSPLTLCSVVWLLSLGP